MAIPFPDYPRYMQLWLEFAAKMAAAGTSTSSETVPLDAARSMRDSYLRALADYTEEFMRSPQFLEMMKQSTNTAIELRNRANDLMAQAQHAVGAVARPDLDSVLNAVHRCETRVLEKLEELACRVEKLENAAARETHAEAPPRKAVNGKSRSKVTQKVP